ncbi:MAG: hypothetical protein COU69_00045 [Candidatus Pacebacteria bacterium CG10_big_fil_rev_8_21_14_0_10_56_10]|nr:MAG: hypothetical protein COU69_00045 [Candidatus Pacebacteria bacterium CG10_big_fil_rev_8_21_14_0_10_56_10]
MLKPKVVGVIDVVIGLLQLIYISVVGVWVVPRLTKLYGQLGQSQTVLLPTYLVLGLLVLLGTTNLLHGLRLTNVGPDSSHHHRFTQTAVTLLAVNLVLGSLLVGVVIYSSLLPLSSLGPAVTGVR